MPLDMSDEDINKAHRAKLFADADKAQAVAEMAMLELAQKRRDMVPREVAEGVLSDLIAELSQALDRIPYRYPAELGACRNDNEARRAGVLFAWMQVFLRSLIWLVIGVGLLVLYPFSPEEVGSEGFAAASVIGQMQAGAPVVSVTP